MGEKDSLYLRHSFSSSQDEEKTKDEGQSVSIVRDAPHQQLTRHLNASWPTDAQHPNWKQTPKPWDKATPFLNPSTIYFAAIHFFKAQLFSKGKTNLMARIRRMERTPNLRTITSCREERKRKTIDLLTTPTLEPFLFDKLLSQKTIRFQVISEKEEEKSKLGWLCRDEI